MPKRRRRWSYTEPASEAATLSVAIKRIADAGARSVGAYVDLLKSDAGANDVRELQRRTTNRLERAAEKIDIERVCFDVAVFSVRQFARNAKAQGFDLKSLLKPKKKEDRSDARKGPSQAARNLESQFGISIRDRWISGEVRSNAHATSKIIKGLSRTQQSRIADATIKAITKKQTASELAAEIREITGSTVKSARRIAFEQTKRLHASLTKAIALEVGVGDYVWMTQDDDRVRPEHAKRHEKVSLVRRRRRHHPRRRVELPMLGRASHGRVTLTR
jgi:SPP1 gp7 family putative phage head morphogenesis protein